MTDTLAGLDLHMVEGFSQQGRTLRLRGHYDSSLLLDTLEELFRDSETGGVSHTLPGSAPILEDLSVDERYTQLLIVATDRVRDGWYLLRGLSRGVEAEEEGATLYPWELILWFIGTTASYTRSFDLVDVDEVTSDWGI